MKKLNILLLALLLFGYRAGATCTCTTITISVSQEERAIGSFKGVAAGGPINVKITMGNKESIRLEGDQDAVADLVTEVEQGILTIRPKTKWNEWSRRYKHPVVTVYITARKISSLTMSGSGIMDVQNVINTTTLATTLSGSGNIKATANVKSLTAVISGSGSVRLNGKADESSLTLSGSGNFRGKDFAVDKTSVQISGSADVYINAGEEIDAVISGSGNIFYSGHALVKKTIIGSGRIRRI